MLKAKNVPKYETAGCDLCEWLIESSHRETDNHRRRTVGSSRSEAWDIVPTLSEREAWSSTRRAQQTVMSSSPRSPRSYPHVTPDDVLSFTKPTKDFLCALSANRQQIEFLEFTISDYATKDVIFMVGRDHPLPVEMEIDLEALDENAYRLIKYEFSEDVLRLPSIQTSLVFSVGEKEIPNLRMVERHYFRNKLVKSYDFNFGFCIPSSTNTWDAVYEVPPLENELIEAMIANPWETQSDSFYFAEDTLVMHNKASYKYIPEDKAQAKKSYEDRFGDAKGTKKLGSKYDSDEGDEEGENELSELMRNRNRSDYHAGGLGGGEQKAGGKYDTDHEDFDGDDEESVGERRTRRDVRGMSTDGSVGDGDSWSKEVGYY